MFSRIKIYFALFLSICLGCQSYNVIQVENDIVYSIKRVKVNFEYGRAIEQSSPLQIVDQTIIKEISASNVTVYRVFDVVTMQRNSFDIEKKVFLIVDNESFEAQIESFSSEITRSINDKKQDVRLLDSTKISVVTGYVEQQKKVTYLSYIINSSGIEKIRNAKTVIFRYYAGPDMISVKCKNLDILKKIIETP